MNTYHIELGDYENVCRVIKVKEPSLKKAIARGLKLLKKHEGTIHSNNDDDCLVQISIVKKRKNHIIWDYMNGQLS